MNIDKIDIPKHPNIGGKDPFIHDPKHPSEWTIPDIPDYTIPIPGDKPDMYELPVEHNTPDIIYIPGLPDEPVDVQYPDIDDVINPPPRDPSPETGHGGEDSAEA